MGIEATLSASNGLNIALLALGLALLSAVAALPARRWPRLMSIVVFPLLGLSGLGAITAGILGLLDPTAAQLTLPVGLPWLAWHLRLDSLSALFLLIIGLIVACVALYGPGYVRAYAHGRDALSVLGGFTGVFVAAMELVVLANDAFVFMVAWETMSLSSYFLVVFQHDQAPNRRAGLLYLLIAHLGGLAILLGFSILASFGHGFDFTAMRALSLPPVWASLAVLLAFIGFGAKAGLLPLHAWLPEAHPAAPSHVSALMSGVMLKMAVYGFVRFTFYLVGDIQWGWGVMLLIVGGLTALYGVLFALVQQDIKRLLAYSSVENLGIIFMMLGLSLVFLGTGHPALGALALVAALYHSLNHAVFKSLLFLGAGAVLHAAHERNLENMGGLFRRMPWTAGFFLIGTMSIASLPPLNGFASEWLALQAALQVWVLKHAVLRILVPIVAAMLALTAALGAAAFVRAYGIGFLGQARSRAVRRAREVSLGMRTAQGLLALLCLVLGVLSTQVVETLARIPEQLFGQGLPQATANGGLWLTPVSSATASYSAPLVLLALLVAGLIAALLLRRTRVRRADAWGCGFAPPGPRMQTTAAGFAQPLRRVFAPVFKVDEGMDTAASPGGGTTRYHLHIGDHLLDWLYAPVVRAVRGAARHITRMQSGNVRTYLGGSLITLLVLLWIVSL